MTPDDPGFHEILYTAPPPDLMPTDSVLCYVVGVDGMPRSVNSDAELNEYLWGGEYDEMMQGEEENDLIEVF
jgi:hypothetical protein